MNSSSASYLKILISLFTLFAGFGCSETQQARQGDSLEEKIAPKSELVQRLEAIFYSEDFVVIAPKTFNVADFGAVGDGKTLNTAAIQQAIDAASAAGGGKVIFPPGTYLSGALFVKSNVNLHLDEGVIIQAIQDDQHFPDRWTRVAGIEMDWPAALINVYEQENVRITGKGVIDGNGKYWWDKFWGDPPRSGGMWVDYQARDIRWAVDYDCKRVRPVVVYKSKEVLLKDFTVKRAGFWTISLTYSQRVHVDGLVIRNNIGGYGPSSDGINTDSSSDILVENSDISCNDDNLCIKAGRDFDGLRVNKPAENIVYRNCITREGHGLFTLGSETSGGVRNVEVYGLEAKGTNTGIRFKSAKVRGGLIEDIWFHDIKMDQVKSPFHFELNWYPEYSYPTIPEAEKTADMPIHWKVMTTPVEPPEKGIPEFRNLRLSHITVTGAETGIYANAYPEKPIHHLSWKEVSIEAREAGLVNHAADWKMENVLLSTEENEALKLQHCERVELPQWTTSGANLPAKSELTLEEQIKQMSSQNPAVTIIPVNPEDQHLIAETDTTSFSEKMALHLLSTQNSSFRYMEPLGDGFYFSPVDIRLRNSELAVSGENSHEWTIYLHALTPPKNVKGADRWSYDENQHQLIMEKAAMKFEITIEN